MAALKADVRTSSNAQTSRIFRGKGCVCVCVLGSDKSPEIRTRPFHLSHKILACVATPYILFSSFIIQLLHKYAICVPVCSLQKTCFSCFFFYSVLVWTTDDKFIFSGTFYLITVPGHLLVLPLPVCFRGNPSFVSQGSSTNWENLNLSSELKQLERI